MNVALLALAGAIALWPLAVILGRRVVAWNRRERRLAAAFDRGRRAGWAGTGELGTPRPVHGERAWFDRRLG